jgi:GPH family glycoside/pentoside/hexuronide:cation symporter
LSLPSPAADVSTTRAELRTIDKVAYGLGGAGWVVVDRLLLTWALYFYMPPPDVGLPMRLPAWTFFGVLTLWGAISIGGRVIDSITDPMMAAWTDRSRHPLGRRRVFMGTGAVPLAIMCALVFSPPDVTATWLNALFVGVALTGFYLAFTVYNVPYAALLPELGRTAEGTLKLSVLQSALQIGAAAVVMVGAPALLGALTSSDGHDKSAAFTTMGVLFSAFGAILMLAPVVVIDEPRYVTPGPPSDDSVFTSLKGALSAPEMRWFLVGSVSYWFGFNTVAQGVPYYVAVLMQKPESYASVVLTGVFVVTGLFFPFIPWLARRVGRAKLMMFGALLQAAFMTLIAFIRDPVVGTFLMALAGAPIALVMAVPNAILSDLARNDTARTGKRREAMIFAGQAFFLKVNLGVSAAILAGLLTLGNSVENPLGVQLSGPVAACILLVSAFAFYKVHRMGVGR